jgi:Tol biopolymer transport system component
MIPSSPRDSFHQLNPRTAALCLGALATVMAGAPLGAAEADFIKNPRQLTLEGRRSGEGYFSADGRRLVFQSEREPGNPFYQIYLMDLETGDTTRISPGVGKTTCAWVHPDGKTVLFASTHEDVAAREKQDGELKQRAEGTQRRYAWDYDETFDLYAARIGEAGRQEQAGLQRLTQARGYDAEGAYSPDGRRIVFASNREAYTRDLGTEERERLEIDKQYFCDIYTMNADGTDVRRLTDVPGYDGGPFFSADGKKICWRRFDEKGERAEIWTMNADGTDQRQITKLGAMSWAPFFHPSGQYLVFATNTQGFDNFELYMVDAEGKRDPVRVTETPGFDGLPSFSPDGGRLSWTSTRTAEKTSQIFLADWDHAAALKVLGLGHGIDAPETPGPFAAALAAEISPQDIRSHVTALASEKMEGRLPGTEGERLATQHAADALAAFGLTPAGDNGSWFQSFEFTAGVELGEGNTLAVSPAAPGAAAPKVDVDWRPLSFSTVGPTDALPVVFAGYGIELSDDGPDAPGYSSYFHLDVKDKWVMVLRYQPEGIPQSQRGRFIQASSLRFKAMTARQRGAKGLIVVSGPNSKVREQLVPLTFDASLAGSGLAAISITDALARDWLARAGKDLQSVHDELDKGQPVAGFDIKDFTLAATINLKQEKRTGRNVLARLPAGADAEPGAPALLIGAHIDHLGREYGGNSRATEQEKGLIHFGADDNASGTAGVLEVAQWLAAEKAAGRLALKRDILFALWSGEEAGLLGSTHFVKSLAKATKGEDGAKLDGVLAACLNMDMIGRLEKSLVLQGLGSSDWWKPQIEKRNVPVGLALTLQSDCYAPTDTTSFYPRGVPILNAFTGNHEDYHRPSDTADKLNYEGAAKVTRLMGLIARDLATGETAPVWKEYKTSEQQGQRAAMRAYLGTVPDYSQGDEPGVKLSGVSPVGPAAKAGVRGGDVIIGLGGKDILNIYDYTAILGELKVNAPTDIVVKRGGETLTLKITPTSRD